ncbi:MAG: RNA polymerase factor sigma-32 [Bdellovibrionota bacterium]
MAKKKKTSKKSPAKKVKPAKPSKKTTIKGATKKKVLPKKSSIKELITIHDPEIMDENVPVKIPTFDIAKHDESGIVPSDPLQQYLNEIRKYPLLTPEEEKELAVRYFEKGDPLAAEKLVTSNLRFVVKIALEYAKMGAKMMDIVQEGNVGLMHAVKEYNPYKGVKLITYAVWWIRGYIREYLLKQYSMVKIGTTQNQKKLFYNLEKEKRKLLQEGEQSTTALLSSRLNIPERDVRLMEQRMGGKDVSLDAPVDEDGNTHLVDLQSDSSNPESELEVLELIDLLKDKIEEIKPSLNDKELDILENRILADEPQTLQEIGDKYGISRERARQLEERLLKNLKEKFLAIANDSILSKIED